MSCYSDRNIQFRGMNDLGYMMIRRVHLPKILQEVTASLTNYKASQNCQRKKH